MGRRFLIMRAMLMQHSVNKRLQNKNILTACTTVGSYIKPCGYLKQKIYKKHFVKILV